MKYDVLRFLAKKYKLKQKGTKETLISRILQYKQPINNFHNKTKIWNTKTYNKKDEFNIRFNINTFPHFHTNLPKHCKTGAVTGQLHSYLVTNTISYEDYMSNVIKLFKQLISRNCYPAKIHVSKIYSSKKTNLPQTSSHSPS